MATRRFIRVAVRLQVPNYYFFANMENEVRVKIFTTGNELKETDSAHFEDIWEFFIYIFFSCAVLGDTFLLVVWN